MSINYNKLWKLLIDKNLKQTDLEKMTSLSHSTIAKLKNEENVNTDVLERICLALDCQLEDIAEVRGDNNE